MLSSIFSRPPGYNSWGIENDLVFDTLIPLCQYPRCQYRQPLMGRLRSEMDYRDLEQLQTRKTDKQEGTGKVEEKAAHAPTKVTPLKISGCLNKNALICDQKRWVPYMKNRGGCGGKNVGACFIWLAFSAFTRIERELLRLICIH